MNLELCGAIDALIKCGSGSTGRWTRRPVTNTTPSGPPSRPPSPGNQGPGAPGNKQPAPGSKPTPPGQQAGAPAKPQESGWKQQALQAGMYTAMGLGAQALGNLWGGSGPLQQGGAGGRNAFNPGASASQVGPGTAATAEAQNRLFASGLLNHSNVNQGNYGMPQTTPTPTSQPWQSQ